MSDLPLLISEFGLYLFIGIAWLVSIGVIAVINAKECTLPAECFDCSESTCRKCNRPNTELRIGQRVWKPDSRLIPMLTCNNAAALEGSISSGK